MKYYGCQYSLIRFAPFQETDEFANIGVLISCEELQYFDFRIETQKTARYTNFFRNLESSFFKFAAKEFEQELLRLKQICQKNASINVRETFSTVTHPREAAVYFGNTRALLTKNPREELDRLFNYYVEQGFTEKPNHKKDYEARIKNWLNDLNLPAEARFKQAKVGTPEYEATLPLVQSLDKHTKIIQPFYFSQDNATKIFQYADNLLNKFKRLKSLESLPEKTLFTVEAGGLKDNLQKEAFDKVLIELHEFTEVAHGDDEAVKEQVLDFAS